MTYYQRINLGNHRDFVIKNIDEPETYGTFQFGDEYDKKSMDEFIEKVNSIVKKNEELKQINENNEKLKKENKQLVKEKERYKRLSEIRNETINNRILTIKEFIKNCSDNKVRRVLKELFYSEVKEFDLSAQNRELLHENEELKSEKKDMQILINTISDQRNEFHRVARENANRVGKLEKENEKLKQAYNDAKKDVEKKEQILKDIMKDNLLIQDIRKELENDI